MTRRLCMALALVMAASSSRQAGAQRVQPDPRSVQMPHLRTLPVYPSVQAFRSAASSRILSHRIRTGPGHATPLGQALQRQLASSGRIEVIRAPNGTASWISGRLGRLGVPVGKRASAAAVADAALRVLEPLSSVMRVSHPSSELTLDRMEIDRLGQVHVRFNQSIDGTPVWAREVLVHADASGEVIAVNGSYEPSARHIRRSATLDADGALRRVERVLMAEGRWNPPSERLLRRFGIDPPTAEAVYYPTEDGRMVRAWHVLVHPNLVQWYELVVDADSGELLEKIARHCTLVPDSDLGSVSEPVHVDLSDVEPFPSPFSGTFLDATATDLNGVSRSMRVYQENAGLHYAIWDLPNITAFSLPDIPSVGGAITMTANNQDDFDRASHVTTPSNTWTDASVVSAHVNMETAYRYYADTFGRKAINDRDESMLSIVHITEGGQSMENAFWTGRIMGYGDGGTYFKPLAGGLDVAAHEMSHGVIEHTANLVYQYQPGALNESMADVFGAFVDRGDFLMGEDIMMPGVGAALRDMEDPASPDLLADFRQPTHMNEYANLPGSEDEGGVHVNSGIPNRAAVMVIKAIGYEKAEQIYYRALSTYLTRTSQFGDARTALERAATDLHGAQSAEVAAVSSAFDAVGIGSTTSGPGSSEGNEVQPVSGSEFIYFLLDDDNLAFVEMATLDAYLVDAISNGTTQLSASADGSGLWFIDQDGVLARLNTYDWSVDTLPDVFIQQPGDLWNVAITPDESVAVLASIYEDDPNLYATDGVEMVTIELKAQTTQNGIFDESIVYPDVISISPNPDVPRVAFDALRRIEAGGDLLEFWSIFEIDFDSGSILNLIPAQPEGLSVGNIAYGRTDPDLVAFNTFADDGEAWSVWVADLASGSAYMLDTSMLTNAERPSFSPDDNALVFTTTDTNELIFFDGTTEELSALGVGVPIHHPVWFAQGTSGTAVEAGDTPAGFRLDSVYPNPFSRHATIDLSISQAGPVIVTVVDVLGREVARLHDGPLAAGAHAFTWSPAGRASGTYLVRVQAGAGTVQSRAMLLAR